MDQAELKALLHYDPERGVFTWRKSRTNRVKPGAVAGSTMRLGYRRIDIGGRKYKEHRLAFLYMTGSFPPHHVDHINGHPEDNRWANLRSATAFENMKNQKTQAGNTSGFIGVSWHSRTGKWQAYINANNRRKYIGIFTDKDTAYLARKAAEKLYGYHPNHGRAV